MLADLNTTKVTYSATLRGLNFRREELHFCPKLPNVRRYGSLDTPNSDRTPSKSTNCRLNRVHANNMGLRTVEQLFGLELENINATESVNNF